MCTCAVSVVAYVYGFVVFLCAAIGHHVDESVDPANRETPRWKQVRLITGDVTLILWKIFSTWKKITLAEFLCHGIEVAESDHVPCLFLMVSLRLWLWRSQIQVKLNLKRRVFSGCVALSTHFVWVCMYLWYNMARNWTRRRTAKDNRNIKLRGSTCQHKVAITVSR